MAKSEYPVLAIHVFYPDGRLVAKLETKIQKHSDIVGQLYLKSLNKNSRMVVRSASYLVIAQDMRTLKIMLTQTQKNDNLLITF